jgi:hypothetical protein
MNQQLSSRLRTKRRTGISIIEVLTSIVVAMIGVFGVMVMIPFAISQAQQGLDNEKASSLLLNAASEFEIRNHTNTQRWAGVDGAGNLLSVGQLSGRPYMIDPIGVADRIDSDPTAGSGQFPFLHPSLQPAVESAGVYREVSGGPPETGNTDQTILIDRVTITDQAGVTRMSRRLASHLFAWGSELVFNEPTAADLGGLYPDTEIAPPQQVLDALPDGTPSNRQLLKEMEYAVIVVPDDVAADGPYNPIANDRVVGWRNYFLAYKDRPSPVASGVGEEAYDRLFEVTSPIEQAGIAIGAPPYAAGSLTDVQKSYRTSIAGGDLVLTEVFPAGEATVDYSSKRAEIRRGDWMMLINVTFVPSRARYFKQINFYKVVDADLNDGFLSGVANGNQDPGEPWSVSLQGPDFDFQFPIESNRPFDPNGVYGDPMQVLDGGYPVAPSGFGAEVDADLSIPEFQIRPSRTFAVHLPNVFAVFERTYR